MKKKKLNYLDIEIDKLTNSFVNRNKKINYLNIEIDKLTNSIENRITGEIFETEISLLSKKDAKQIKKSDWQFDWNKELNYSNNQINKLVTVENPLVIHGLISIINKPDHIFIDLIENAKFNIGKEKMYEGVAGNLVAFACKLSFEKNYYGYVSFLSKTNLIKHYEISLGAKKLTGNRMFLDEKNSLILVKQYFKNFNHG